MRYPGNQMMNASSSTLTLASTSFRRQVILRMLGLTYTVINPDFEEAAAPIVSDPEEYVKSLAVGKLLSVVNAVDSSFVLAADTVIHYQEKYYGKPRSLDDARSMLKLFSGNTHTVYTAVSICNFLTQQLKTAVAQTAVTFYKLKDQQIEQYLNTGEPLGKAGSYALQGQGYTLIDQLNGDASTVIGLSATLALSLLKDLDYPVPQTAILVAEQMKRKYFWKQTSEDRNSLIS